MNEQDFAQELRGVLDEGAARLPYRITHRLEQARLAALARQRTSEVQLAPLAATGPETTSVDETGSVWWRLVVATLPILLLAAGLFVISVWNDTEQADEIAEIDTAVLTDEVPLSAYTDRGFGVFLKNSRQ